MLPEPLSANKCLPVNGHFENPRRRITYLDVLLESIPKAEEARGGGGEFRRKADFVRCECNPRTAERHPRRGLRNVSVITVAGSGRRKVEAPRRLREWRTRGPGRGEAGGGGVGGGGRWKSRLKRKTKSKSIVSI